jgi:hypothetical protein
MKKLLFMLSSLALIGTACQPRAYNNANVASNTNNPKDAKQINAKAFNAFKIWEEGSGEEMLNYPGDYDQYQAGVADGVFYVAKADFLDTSGMEAKFIGVPTPQVRVEGTEGNILTYPLRNGKGLQLKFVARPATTSSATVLFGNMMRHLDAATYCTSINMRLPTARELFDFCATGTPPNFYGPNFKPRTYPNNARCAGKAIWSASVDPKLRSKAWSFDSVYGALVRDGERGRELSVVCVGSI